MLGNNLELRIKKRKKFEFRTSFRTHDPLHCKQEPRRSPLKAMPKQDVVISNGAA
jgi:hypothetical protein